MKHSNSLSSKHLNDEFDVMKKQNANKKKTEYKRKEKYKKNYFSDEY